MASKRIYVCVTYRVSDLRRGRYLNTDIELRSRPTAMSNEPSQPKTEAVVRLDPLVRTYLVQEIRKIVEAGIGKRPSSTTQAAIFGREWFDGQAKALKAREQFILVRNDSAQVRLSAA